MKKTIRLGSRGSPLALLQAEEVRKKLLSVHPDLYREADIDIVPIRTSGDWQPGQLDISFRESGGNKELFTKEIELALMGGHIDMAVHSMKDLSSLLPPGLEIIALLERVDPRDAFIGRTVRHLDDLPAGASIGTSSLRRQAQILARRPDIEIVPLRGNVETRLQKLKDGKADAIVLAMAGIIRLGLDNVVSSVLDSAIMLPAAAQGAIGIEIRQDDDYVRNILKPINHPQTSVCVMAERALLRELDGSCHTPIGAFAHLRDANTLSLEGLAAMPDGSSLVRLGTKGSIADAESIGIELGRHMKSMLPPDFFAA
jgi:hydroxymethylbilane synthase